jgi:ABC-type transport system involved in cytochrome c biogenesis permease subunit
MWAKPTWGVWWAWDSRGTLQLLLLIVYSAYLVLRAYVPNPIKRASLSAVFGILGAIDVPFNYMSIRWYRTQHPSALTFLDIQMQVALVICFGFMVTLYLFLLAERPLCDTKRYNTEFRHLRTNSILLHPR